MRKGFVQKFSAFFLMFAFLLSATAIAPLSIAAQTTDDKSKKDEKKDKKDKQKAEKQTTTTAVTDGKKTLSTMEDPNMIGKRNINGGGDKLWGWLGGSKEKEVQVGRQLALEVEQQAKLVEDEVITEYVNRVGQNIVLHSDAKVPFTIKVIDSDEVNAFALPGGFFFVNKGLILAADNESELAGVMAHEIAHVAARHAMENQGKATAMNYGMLAGIIFGGGIISSVLQNLRRARNAEIHARRGRRSRPARCSISLRFGLRPDRNGDDVRKTRLAKQKETGHTCQTFLVASAIARPPRCQSRPRSAFSR